MDIDKLERANFLAKRLLPKIDELLNMSSKSSHYSRLAGSIWGLSEYDEEFKAKFKKLLLETKKKWQKEFDEL